MKFTTIVLALTIASATQVNARRRHLNTIKGEESDASMSMSMLSPARGGGSKSKSATGAPTSAPIPEVCDLCLFLCFMKRRYDDDDIKHFSLTTLTLTSYNYSLVNVILSLTRVIMVMVMSLLSKKVFCVIAVKIRP